MTTTPTFSLEQIRIASPCPVKWESMRGDDVKRFCKHCSLHVFNLSNMTRADAEALVLSAEGRMCATYWRRADGTVITKDCPVGAAEVRRKRARMIAAVAAFAALGMCAFGSWALGQSRWNATKTRLSGLEPFRTVRAWVITPPPQQSWGVAGSIGLYPPNLAPTTPTTTTP